MFQQNARFTRPILLALLFVGSGILYFQNLAAVPFHPDETTLIYTSQEFDTLITAPRSLAWEPEQDLDDLTRFRLLDEPLSRLIFGMALSLTGTPSSSLPNDWDWTQTWKENQLRQAVPEENVLLVARATIALFTLASVPILYYFVKKIGSSRAALLAVLFFSLNGAVLLHGRRAMREGVMLFGISLFIWSLLWASKKPLAAGLAAAFMLCARYSTAPLVPIALLAAMWIPKSDRNIKQMGKNAVVFGTAFIGLFLFLQPVLWKHPVRGIQEMIRARSTFTAQGLETALELAPQAVVSSTEEKIAGLVYQSFIGPLSYFDVANYVEETAEDVATYDANALNHIWRGLVMGSALMFLSISGIILAVYRGIKQPKAPKKFLALLGLALLFEISFILLAIPFPFQRYYLPLLPFFSIFAGLIFVSWEETGNISRK